MCGVGVGQMGCIDEWVRLVRWRDGNLRDGVGRDCDLNGLRRRIRCNFFFFRVVYLPSEATAWARARERKKKRD